MTNKEVGKVLDRVRAWPESRQKDAARMLLEMESHDVSPYHLTDDQLAEVRRRRAKKHPKLVSLADARKRFKRLGV